MEESFEYKLKKAQEILGQLKQDNLELMKSVELHKQGIKLLDEASEILNKAKISISEINDD